MRGVRNKVPCEIRISRELVFSLFLYDALVGRELCFKRVLLYWVCRYMLKVPKFLTLQNKRKWKYGKKSFWKLFISENDFFFFSFKPTKKKKKEKGQSSPWDKDQPWPTGEMFHLQSWKYLGVDPFAQSFIHFGHWKEKELCVRFGNPHHLVEEGISSARLPWHSFVLHGSNEVIGMALVIQISSLIHLKREMGTEKAEPRHC